MPPRKTACPRCREAGGDTAGDNLQVYIDGGYCHACGYTLTKKQLDQYLGAPSMTEPRRQRSEQDIAAELELIKTYPFGAPHKPDLPANLVQRAGIRYSVDDQGNPDAVYYPYYEGGHITDFKVRRLPKTFYCTSGKVNRAELFGQHLVQEGRRGLLVLVEGEDDKVAAEAMFAQTGMMYTVLSLQNGANEEGKLDSAVKRQFEFINSFKKVALCLDMDKPGKATTKALAEVLAPTQEVRLIKLPEGYKDAYDMYAAGQAHAFREALNNAERYTPEGIIEGPSITLAELQAPMQPGYALPFPMLEKKLHGLRKAEITLVTAGCVDADTEYLTPTGWKPICEYDGGKVGQYNDGCVEFVEPLLYYRKPNLELTRFTTFYGVDQVLSDGHKVVYWNHGNPEAQEIPFSEMRRRHEGSVHGFAGRFKTTFDYEGLGIEMTEGELRLQVAVIADGRVVKEGAGNYTQMRFRKERKYQRLIEICEQYGLRYSDRSKPGCDFEVIVWPKHAHKEFTEYYWACDKHQLEIILDEMRYWDGDLSGRFSSTSKASVDFIQFAYAATGTRSTISVDKRAHKYAGGYCASVQPAGNPTVGITNRHNKVKMEPYRTRDGLMYCFSVPSGKLVFRRNGKIFISGNTGIGKTTWLRETGYHLITHHGLTIGSIYLEEQWQKTVNGYIAIDNNVPLPLLRIRPNIITQKQWQASYDKLLASGKTHYFKHFGSVASEHLIAKMRYMAIALGCDFIFLDHVTMVMSGNDTLNERKDIDILMTRLAELVNETGVGVIPVVHLKRSDGKDFNHGEEVGLTDLRGSSQLEALSWNVIALERDQQGTQPDVSKLRLLKNREWGSLGVCDRMVYNPQTGRMTAIQTGL